MIGLDISERSVKIVRLFSRHGRIHVECAREPVPEHVIIKGLIVEPTKLANSIRQALATCKVNEHTQEPVVASIPEDQSFLRVLEIPIMAEKEMKEAIQWQMLQHVPFGIENIYLDWQPLSEGHQASAQHREILVGVSPKKVIDPLHWFLTDLGLDVCALELESQAIVRALVSPDIYGSQGLLIIDIGFSSTNIIIHDHGTMRFTNSFAKGLSTVQNGLSTEDKQLIAQTADQKLPATEIDRLAQPIAASLNDLVSNINDAVNAYQESDTSHHITDVILTGSGANLPGLDKAFLRYFSNINIQRGNPWINILSGHPRPKIPLSIEESLPYTTAIGLALRPNHL